MENILKHKRELDKITFGGNPVDEFVDYDIPIPKNISGLYELLLDSITEYFYELKNEKHEWFIYHMSSDFNWDVEVFGSFLRRSKEKKDLKNQLRQLVAIVGGCLSDLSIEKELKVKHIPKDVDIFLSSNLLNCFIIARTVKEGGSINDLENLEFGPKDFSLIDEWEFEQLENMIETILGESLVKSKNMKNITNSKECQVYSRARATIKLEINNLNVDIIYDDFINIESKVSNFDFSFRKFYYNGKVVRTTRGALYDLKNKKLHLSQLDVTLDSLLRGYDFEDRYKFNFLEITRKLLTYYFVREEMDSIWFDSISSLSNIAREEVLNEGKKKYDILLEGERAKTFKQDLKVFEYVLDLIKNTDLAYDEIFERSLLKKVSLLNNYKDKYKERLSKLFKWAMTLDIDLRFVRDQELIKNKELRILVGLVNEYGVDTFYYSKIKEYYIDNELYELTSYRKEIPITPLGVPDYLYDSPSFEIEGKTYTKNDLIEIKKKIDMLSTFRNKESSSSLHAQLEIYKKLGIELKGEEGDVFDAQKNEKLKEFSLILNVLKYKNLKELGVVKESDKGSVENFIKYVKEKSGLNNIFVDNFKSLFIDKIIVSYNFSLRQLISNERVSFSAFYKKGEKVYYHMMELKVTSEIIEDEHIEVEQNIDHPLVYLNSHFCSLDEYLNNFRDEVCEKIMDDILKPILKNEKTKKS